MELSKDTIWCNLLEFLCFLGVLISCITDRFKVGAVGKVPGHYQLFKWERKKSNQQSKTNKILKTVKTEHNLIENISHRSYNYCMCI